jgi:clan AA aspartic protease
MMGLTYAEITLVNSFDITSAKKGIIAEADIKKMNVRALVDSGAMMLTINDTIANQLDLEVQDQVEIALANGSRSKCDLVGPIDIRFKNRSTTCRALVLPGADEVLLGVIPLEAMDVIIDPLLQQLVVHPDRPYLAQMKVK